MYSNDFERFYALCFQNTLSANEAKKVILRNNSIKDLWDFAKREDAVSIIGESVLGANVSTDFAIWRDAVDKTESTLKKYFELTEKVCASLSEQNITVIALKNSGLVIGYDYSLASTPMGDVDLLIDPCDFSKAHDEILKLGFELGDRSPFNHASYESAIASGGTEYSYKLPNGEVFWLELQWRPVAGRWIQPSQEPAAKSLIGRAKRINGSSCCVLSPEDNLLQVALHTAKHTYVRSPGFRLHSDVHRIVSAETVDWQCFCDSVEDLRVCTAVYLSLLIPHEYLETPIPKSTLKRLNKYPIKNFILYKVIQKAGLFNHNQKKFSKITYILFNLALYDNVNGMLRAIFPDYETMQKNYGAKSKMHSILCHIRRIYDLLFNRAKT